MFTKQVRFKSTYIAEYSWLDTRTRHMNTNCHPLDMKEVGSEEGDAETAKRALGRE